MGIEEKEKCNKFETCSAVLCPLDLLPRQFWYSDSEICHLRIIPEWVKTQRKIQKANSNPHFWFTLKMIKSIDRVKTGIIGIQNNGYSEKKEHTWLKERADKQNNQVASVV